MGTRNIKESEDNREREIYERHQREFKIRIYINGVESERKRNEKKKLACVKCVCVKRKVYLYLYGKKRT